MNNKDYEELKKDFQELIDVNTELKNMLSSQNAKLSNLYNSLKQSNEKLKVGDEVEFTNTLEKAIIICIDESGGYHALVFDGDRFSRTTKFYDGTLEQFGTKTGRHFDEVETCLKSINNKMIKAESEKWRF